MSPEDLLRHFTIQQDNLRKDIREMIIDSNIVTHAKVIDEVDKINIKVDQIISHQERQNGMLDKHESKLNWVDVKHAEIQSYQNNCPAIRVINGWKTLTMLLVFLVLVVDYAYHNIPWNSLLELIKKIL